MTSFVGNRMLARYVTVCEIITYELPNEVNSNFDLKMKVEDVDDLDDNWQTNLLCQLIYIRMKKKWRLFVNKTFPNISTLFRQLLTANKK